MGLLKEKLLCQWLKEKNIHTQKLEKKQLQRQGKKLKKVKSK